VEWLILSRLQLDIPASAIPSIQAARTGEIPDKRLAAWKVAETLLRRYPLRHCFEPMTTTVEILLTQVKTHLEWE